jgi:hypothetical protein
MVRLKTRWLVVEIDGDMDSSTFPSKSQLAKFIREKIIQNFGIARSSAALDTHGLYKMPVVQSWHKLKT